MISTINCLKDIKDSNKNINYDCYIKSTSSKDIVAIPLTILILGGARSLQDLKQVINKYKIIGVAAGSLFVFKGVYRAVLINYPSPVDKHALYASYNNSNE